MTMKVDGEGVQPISSKKTERVKRTYSNKAGSAGPVQSGRKDVANVSSEAMLLVKTRGQLDSVPEVRSELIQSLKESIANGTYSISAEKLADLLLNQLKNM